MGGGCCGAGYGGECGFVWSLGEPLVVLLDVGDEFLVVAGSCGGCEDYASDAFFQCGSDGVYYCFVEVVKIFGIVSCTVEVHCFFGFGDVAEYFP